MHLYVDGQLVASNTTNQAQDYLTVGYWRVGADDLSNWPNAPSSNYFGGSISDASFFLSELTAGQVQTQYNASPAS
jgi:hypothetical protein